MLMNLLAQQGIKKDSHNSHNPPSEDKNTPRRKSLRRKTGKKPGGQKGHKGTTLQQSKTPNKTNKLISNYCSECGDKLDPKLQKLISKRQLIEIPPIIPVYIEYQQYGCNCTKCGHLQKASYPSGVNAPIQYGSSVVALMSYFNVYQYIPYKRTTDMFNNVFNLPISEGSVQNLLKKLAKKATPVYDEILNKIQESTNVGSDETSAKVNGDKWWMWVWQNVKNTYIAATKSRGFETVRSIIGNSLSHITLCSDRWAAQLKVNTKFKQLCIAHLLRDLIYLNEVEQLQWTKHFETLLSEGLRLRRKAEDLNRPFIRNEKQVYKIEQRLNRLLIRNIDKEKHPKTFAFQKSMIKNRNHLFTFLYNLEVPPDNNASERAIRNIKVKQKVSGQFKTGQNTFAKIRSVIDTLNKRELNILQNLQQIANLVAE